MYDIVDFDKDIIEDERILDGLPVKSLKRYRFLRTIGFGRISAITLVEDVDTGRVVALSSVPAPDGCSRAELARFVYEAKLLARLEHPNITPVHDIGMSESGSPFFTMKYMRGDSLSVILDRLRAGNDRTREEFPLQRMLRIFVRICNAVDFAHANGFGHFDLKPEIVNIGVFGDVTVFGWGQARLLEDQNYEKADASNSLGKPGFLAPEQIKSLNGASVVGRAADVYALGAILYAMLTWRSPMANRNRAEALMQTPRGVFLDAAAFSSDGEPVPTALEHVVKKAMSVRPANRYDNAQALRNEVLSYLNGYATKAEKATFFRRLELFVNRQKLALLAVIILLLVLTVAVLLFS